MTSAVKVTVGVIVVVALVAPNVVTAAGLAVPVTVAVPGVAGLINAESVVENN